MEYICGAYDRLSDADNKVDESSSIQSQKIIIDSFAKFNNLKIYRHYVDDGYSGGNFDRPAFQEMIEDIENSMKGLLEPVYEEIVTGHAEIRQIFKFSKVGNIAGSHVTDGVIKNGSKARLIRDGIVLYTGSIKSVQREKDQVKEVKKDMDCGITLENYQDIKENDVIETYDLNEIKR